MRYHYGKVDNAIPDDGYFNSDQEDFYDRQNNRKTNQTVCFLAV